ncbi:M23 family metallopeptidase [Coprothermobacteraceae bacterium]|nr:M23 family metallopeptidase [Coprothermobacteraceae bacterium]
MKHERLESFEKAVSVSIRVGLHSFEVFLSRDKYRAASRIFLIFVLCLGILFFQVQQTKGITSLAMQKQSMEQTAELVVQYEEQMALLKQQNELLLKFKEEQMKEINAKLAAVVDTAASTLKKPALKTLISSTSTVAYRGDSDVETEIQALEAKIDKVQSTLEKYKDALDTFPDKWPTYGNISSYFGWRRWSSGWVDFHTGLDVSNGCGTPIYAAGKGTVTFAGRNGLYGLMIEIRHGNGYTTRYGHLSKILVKVGDTVMKGDQIGVMGSTGFSTGCHLHFEVYINGSVVDPLKVLR